MGGYRVVGGGGGGAGASPTSTYNEPAHIRDAAIWGSSRNDPVHITDAAVWGSTLNDPLHIRDAYSITSIPVYNETLHIRDAGTLRVSSLIVGRSGTPDTDQMSDGWVDQASAGTNHGNESLQCKGASTAPGSDVKIAFLQLDLTRVTGMSATVGGGALFFTASTSNPILATSLTVGFAVQASRWFTESTMTYTTGRPTPSTTALTGPSVAPGAAAQYSVTFTQAQLNTMLTNWVIFQFTTAGGAVPDTVTILSRDDATAGNRPLVTLNLSIT